MTYRILALVGGCYGDSGGIARYNQDLFESLVSVHLSEANSQAQQAEIVILPRSGRANGRLPNRIKQVPAIYHRLLYSLMSLWIAWRHRPIDAVFCGHVFMAPLAWGLARLFGAHYWLQVHGIEIWAPRIGLDRAAVEQADLVTAVSRVTRHRLLGWANIAPHRVRVLPNTVRDMFTPGVVSSTCRARFGLNSGPILLSVGRLAAERYKGHDAIFGVLPLLQARYPGLIYVVAGDGDDRERLEARARQLGLGSKGVRFLGYVSEEALTDLYRLADLFVMPSTGEGFGIVYLEAAACGLRVLGGIGDGSGDAIQSESIGMQVDPNDANALLTAIERCLSMGRVEPAAIEPYRRQNFERIANDIMQELMEAPLVQRSA